MTKPLKLLLTLLILLGFPISVSIFSDEPTTQTDDTNFSQQEQTATTTADVTLPPDHYHVTKVVDGDTIAIDMHGERATVRFIGIDTPETVHPTKPVECFGIEASNKAKELLTNAVVWLKTDSTQGEQDKYGRLLAYVFLEDGTNVNEYMIRNGYAYEYTYGKAYEYQTLFKEAQLEAQTEKRGLWADGVCEGE